MDGEINVKDLFRYANSISDTVRNNSELFADYLKIASQTSDFSPTNQLLIMGYMCGNEVTYLDDYNNYINAGITVNNDAKKIWVLQKANNEYGYEPRLLIDVKDTNGIYNPVEHDKFCVIEALINTSPCEIEYHPEAKHARKAMFIPNERKIIVKNGMTVESIFRNLTYEYVHAYFYDKFCQNNSNVSYDRTANELSAYCINYMLTNKYNMGIDEIEIRSTENAFSRIKTKEDDIKFRKDVLTSFNALFNKISSQIDYKLNEMYNLANQQINGDDMYA